MKLLDIIEEWISGDWGSEQSSTEVSEKVYCLRSADISPIYNAAFDTAAVRYISTHSLSRNQLKEGDIVIEKSGGTNSCSTGRVILITKDILAKNTPLVCSNFCAAFRVKENWDSAFVYYYFRLIHRSGVFLNFEGKTSGIHNLLIDTAFATIDFPDVDLSTQKRIASVLSNIDRKIALNRAMNEELEQTARDLYDYWFLQFDFPDANGKPYRSSGGKMVYNDTLKREIPEGWEVKSVGNLLNKVKNTYKVPTKEYLKEGKYPIIDQSTDTYFAGWSNTDDAVVTQHPIVVFGDHSCAVKYVDIDFCRGADGTQLICSNDVPTEYLYFAILNTHISSGYARHFSFLKNTPIIIPNSKYLKLYQTQTRRFFKTITSNRMENNNLLKLRDELLPLLINGQVKVKE